MGARYKAVYRNGKLFAEYENGELTYLDPEYSGPNRSDVVSAPMVIRDIGEYVSPLDGSHITSRTHHRDHMRAHDVIEIGNEPVGKLSASVSASGPKVDRDLGEAIKRRIEEVREMPQDTYDYHVKEQAAEHAEIAALVTATPQE